MSWLERRIPPPLLALATIGLIFAAAHAFPDWRLQSLAQSVVAGCLVLIGVGFDLTAIWHFRRQRTTVNPLRPDAATALVTAGVFQISRNPMYVGLLLIVSGIALHVGSVLAIALVIGLALWLDRWQIVPEERAMRRLFGAAFADYSAQVRRWL